jgi:hypothetical protein
MCKITSAQIAADGKAVGTAIDSIAGLLQATDPTLATQLKAAGDALIQVTSNWVTGSPVAILQDAEQAVIVVLNLIPLTSIYAPFIAIAFAALNLLIANAVTQPQQTGNGVHDAYLLLHVAKTQNTDSPWFGKATIKHHWDKSPAQDFSTAWDGEVDLNPTLGVAKV